MNEPAPAHERSDERSAAPAPDDRVDRAIDDASPQQPDRPIRSPLDGPVRANRLELGAQVLAAGTLLVHAWRVWPSDRRAYLSLLAYVPAPLTVLAALIGLLVLLRRGRRTPSARIWLGVAGAALLVGLARTGWDNRRLVAPRATDEPARLTLVHWNVASSAAVAPVISALAADVMCLSEPSGALVEQLRARAGWFTWRESSLAITARWPLDVRRFVRADGLRAVHAVVGCDPPLSLLLVDVAAHPLYHRRNAFGHLAHLLPELAPRPHVIAGDLNTPAESFTLELMTAGEFTGAYERAGDGLGYTWPSYLPVLRIDHLFVGPEVELARYETGFAWRSDHRWQRALVTAWEPAPRGR